MKPKNFLIFKQLFLRRVQVSYKLFLIKIHFRMKLKRLNIPVPGSKGSGNQRLGSKESGTKWLLESTWVN